MARSTDLPLLTFANSSLRLVTDIYRGNLMEFLLQSRSSANLYTVRVTEEDSGPALTCTCPAGMVGGYCKHRFAVIKGDASDIVEASHDVKNIRAMIAGTKLEAAINRMYELEQTIKEAQTELKKVKKSVARIMNGTQKPETSPNVVTMGSMTQSAHSTSPKELVLSIKGKKIAFTGTLERMTRSEAKQRATDAGATVTATITQGLDILVIGESNTSASKLSKAESLGAIVITEDRFIACLEQ